MALSTGYSKAAPHYTPTPLDTKDIDLTHLDADAQAVLDFWFNRDNERYWFAKNDRFDEHIHNKFGKLWQAASQGECAHWRRTTPSNKQQTDSNSAITNLAGRLAEIIVLDQFSRNLCRGQANAFAQDTMAVALAQEAVAQPQFDALPMPWRQFIIMPFMHSESARIHERYLPLFEQLGDKNTLDFEHRHKDIIDKFGRYPHRNAALNRQSSSAEKIFLQQPHSSF